MRRLARLAPLLLTALLFACGGNDAPSASPSPSPTVDTFPTVERPPRATPTPEGAIFSLDAPRTLETVLLDALPESDFPPFIYDATAQTLLDPASAQYAAAYEALAGNVIRFGEQRLAIRTPDGAWHEVTGADALGNLIPSPDGRTAAVSLGQLVMLLDLETLTGRTLSLRAYPVSFSPDGSRLLLREILERDGIQRLVIVPVDDPVRAAYVPLGTASGYYAGETRWIDGTRLIVLTQDPILLQSVETAGPQPEIVTENPLPSGQIALNPDRSLIAVQLGNATTHPQGVAIYQLDPLRELTRIEGASLAGQYEVPSEVWSPDSSRLLVLFDPCTPQERLVSVKLQDRAQLTLAEGGFFRFVFSPDGKWVAYTAWSREGSVVPADGSAPPRLVSDNVAGPATPRWSPDSRLVAFPMFSGGYDRCV